MSPHPTLVHPAPVAAAADAAARGSVANLFPAEDYGLLRTEDGRELPFYRDSVEAFERLTLGRAVTYREELGERGPEAVAVAVAD
jgi:hypothetical protein